MTHAEFEKAAMELMCLPEGCLKATLTLEHGRFPLVQLTRYEPWPPALGADGVELGTCEESYEIVSGRRVPLL